MILVNRHERYFCVMQLSRGCSAECRDDYIIIRANHILCDVTNDPRLCHALA